MPYNIVADSFHSR